MGLGRQQQSAAQAAPLLSRVLRCCLLAPTISALLLAIGVGTAMRGDGAMALGVRDVYGYIAECYEGRHIECDKSLPLRVWNILADEAVGMSAWTDGADTVAARHLGLVAEPTAVGISDASSGQLHGKVAIVTGASSGIGVETARVLMKHGCHVIFAVRDTQKGDEVYRDLQALLGGSGNATVMRLDTSDLDSVSSFANEFLSTGLPLHYLVTNAGITAPPEYTTSKQGHELVFATNHLGHFLLSRLLEQRLLESGTSDDPARLVVVASGVATLWGGFRDGRLAEHLSEVVPPKSISGYQRELTYQRTKALNVAHAAEQQRRWGPGASAVATSLHPGIVITDIFKKADNIGWDRLFMGPPAAPLQKTRVQGASTTIHCLLSPHVPDEARRGEAFYLNNGPWPRSSKLGAVGTEMLQPEFQQEAWRISEELLEGYLQ